MFESWKRFDDKAESSVIIPTKEPVSIPIISGTGFGALAKDGKSRHVGVDIVGPKGTPIYATADGRIGRAGWYEGYGNLVEIEHGGGIQTRYGHLASFIAKVGSMVKRGQLIGFMGATGQTTISQLHYEIRLDGRALDPTPFLRANSYLLANDQNSASGNPQDQKKSDQAGEQYKKLMREVSQAILDGRCADAKLIALTNKRIDVADQAMRLCEPSTSQSAQKNE